MILHGFFDVLIELIFSEDGKLCLDPRVGFFLLLQELRDAPLFSFDVTDAMRSYFSGSLPLGCLILLLELGISIS